MNLIWLVAILLQLFLSIDGICETMPIISGRALSGDSIQIPSGNGQQLLIMGFDKTSSPLMKDWTIALIASSSVRIEWFQVAMIGSVPPFIDRIITNGIRSMVPDAIHDRFLPYFGKTQPILDGLTRDQPMEKNEVPVIVLMGSDRRIQFQLQGLATTRNIQRVQHALQQNLEEPSQ